jgi:hypothetical protein
MNIHSGTFVLYKGSMFQAILDSTEKKITMISKDLDDLKNGFSKYNDQLFEKTVLETEVEEAFNLTPFAEYRGHTFHLVQDTWGEWNLLYNGEDQEIVEEFGFSMVDRFMYQKKVDLSEIDRVWEEKRIIDLA